MATIAGIQIINRLSVSTLKTARYSDVLGNEVVDVAVGILPNSSSTLTRRVVTIPINRLLNGNWENTRTARYSVLMNVLNAYAEALWNLDFENESVVFLGFNTPTN